VEQARAIVAATPALSLLDGFALVVAIQHPGAILLTGDKRMRQRAESSRIECHGVLWIVEELLKLPNPDTKTLRAALHNWREDPYVRLPASEIERLIELTEN
jgi:hypothetical protein